MYVLEAKNIYFGYTQHRVLENVSFSLSKGDFACITGSNGSGKSTLINLILGNLTAQSGSIQILSEDIKKFRDWPKIGYVPQHLRALSGGFPATAREIVRTSLFSKTGLFRFLTKEQKALVDDALELVDMKPYANQLVSTLSGGQQQRVMLARTLAANPEIMILDEPSSGVDPKNSLALYELLAMLSREKGISTIMVTHDVERSSRYANRVFCLSQGDMVELEKEQIELELAHRHTHKPHSDCCEI